jgi:hypothetical protein
MRGLLGRTFKSWHACRSIFSIYVVARSNGLGNRRSIQLSYGTTLNASAFPRFATMSVTDSTGRTLFAIILLPIMSHPPLNCRRTIPTDDFSSTAAWRVLLGKNLPQRTRPDRRIDDVCAADCRNFINSEAALDPRDRKANPGNAFSGLVIEEIKDHQCYEVWGSLDRLLPRLLSGVTRKTFTLFRL